VTDQPGDVLIGCQPDRRSAGILDDMVDEPIGAQDDVAGGDVVATGPYLRPILAERDGRDWSVFDQPQPVGVAPQETVEHLH
jgi:hypothetical protein